MKDARVCLVTLGIADIARSAAFYAALGWQRTGAGNESVAFLQGEGLVLGLFGRDDLAEDAHVAFPADSPPAPITLAINMPSEAEVDRLYAAALAAGATATKPPEKVFWGGYSGYFSDPDGHLWELAHNPFFALDENGHLDLVGNQDEPSA
ncbi:VOC family protein [Consotaella aegiceratis]|uniref:VOC family protein n=1 Tax=Consotaella aegiceratis TaxID=3097961 RepID=UPI002F40656D